MRKTTILLFITLSFLFTAEGNVLQTIYLQPADQPAPSSKQIDEIRTIMLKTQAFYRAQMDKHGYGTKTFELEKNASGKIIVHIVEGEHNLKAYANLILIETELPANLQKSWLKNKIQIIFLAGAKLINGHGGFAAKICQNNVYGRIAYIPASKKQVILAMTAHEVGHTFTLKHNTEKSTPFKSHIMNAIVKINPADANNLNNYLLTSNEAKILNTHPFFSLQPLSIPFSNYTIKMWSTLKTNY